MNNLKEFQLQQIASLFSYAPPRGVVERELRFGCFVDQKGFQSRVGEHTWSRLLQKFESKVSVPVKSVTTSYETGLRITRYESGKEEYIIKQKGRVYDLHEFGLRFSTDVEIPTEAKIPPVAPSMIRSRLRYQIPFENYTFDLSRVESGRSVSYEIEVEFHYPSTHSYTVDQLKRDILDIYYKVYDKQNKVAIKMLNTLTVTSTSEACTSFTFPKPQDFDKRSFIASILQPFGISLKADGIHKFAITDENRLYIIQLPDMVQTIPLSIKVPPILLEGEEITAPSGRQYFCAFDLLGYHKSSENRYIDIRNKTYQERYQLLTNIVTSTQRARGPLAVKHVCFSDSTNSFYKCTNNALDGQHFAVRPIYTYSSGKDGQPKSETVTSFETDGLVFTPNVSYNDTYTKNIIRKWKPIEKLTIDLLYADGKLMVMTTNLPETFESAVGLTVPMNPPLLTMMDKERLKDRQVGEFIWNPIKERFELYRIRYDKVDGNFIKVAQSLWRLIQDPIKETTIRGTDIRVVRMYHNDIKRDLISQLAEGSIVLDIGGGNGGDLDKYEAVKVKTLLYVEPNPKNLEELKRRLSLKKYNMNVQTLHAYGQETDKIIDFVKRHTTNGKVDVLSMFFSLTFFFASAKDLNDLTNTITSTLSEDGKVIGTYTNGDAMRKLLKDGTFDTPTIKIQYTGKNGLTPEIFLDMKDTIVGEQTEYLVDMKLLTNKLAPDLHLTEDKPFDDVPYFNEFQSRFNSLYNRFTFSKIATKAPTTIRKFVADTFIIPVHRGRNSILHALFQVISEMYRTSDDKDTVTTDFRKELRTVAESIYPLLRLYTPTRSARKFGKGFSDSDKQIDGVAIEFVAEFLAFNILIVNDKKQLLSVNGDSTQYVLKHENCILLLKEGEHYSIIAQRKAGCEPHEYRQYFRTGTVLIQELVGKGNLR